MIFVIDRKKMQKNLCPNYEGCKIINVEDFIQVPDKKHFYMSTYCEAGEKCWNSCKRYQTSGALNLCPDFVLPDSNFTIEEILNKFEEQFNN